MKIGNSFIIMMLMSISFQAAIIVNHNCTDIHQIPDNWINQAKANLRVAFQHSSYGSQIITGLKTFQDIPGSLYYFDYSGWGYSPDVFFNEYGIWGASDLGNPDRLSWATATRDLLNRQGGCDRKVVICSWCSKADTSDPADIDLYLNLMNQLESNFPNVKFVYMTGHLVGSGTDGALNQRNEQIRTYCQQNNKILFDFADIESYDPDALENYMPLGCNDNCDYDRAGQIHNWASEWIAANPDSELAQLASLCGECANSQQLNCVIKARAFWWLLARLAGWDGSVAPVFHTVRFVSSYGGTFNGQNLQNVSHGGDCMAVTAIANEGYHFVNWTGTGWFTSTANPLFVINVLQDMNFTAIFSPGEQQTCAISRIVTNVTTNY